MDEKSQVVLAASLRQSPADCPALPDMLTELAESLSAAGIDGTPRTLLADAGYISANHVDAVTDAGIDPLLASGRLKHGQQLHGRWSHLALPWAQHRLTCAGSWICGNRSPAGSAGSSRCSPISTARRLPL